MLKAGFWAATEGNRMKNVSLALVVSLTVAMLTAGPARAVTVMYEFKNAPGTYGSSGWSSYTYNDLTGEFEDQGSHSYGDEVTFSGTFTIDTAKIPGAYVYQSPATTIISGANKFISSTLTSSNPLLGNLSTFGDYAGSSTTMTGTHTFLYDYTLLSEDSTYWDEDRTRLKTYRNVNAMNQLFRGGDGAKTIDVDGYGLPDFENTSPQYFNSFIFTSTDFYDEGGTFLKTDYYTYGFNGLATVKITRSDQVVATVPEPDQWAMLIAGFGLIGGAMRVSRKARVQAPAVAADG